jgi:hypothetical protein
LLASHYRQQFGSTLEVVSKRHLMSDSCVVPQIEILTY